MGKKSYSVNWIMMKTRVEAALEKICTTTEMSRQINPVDEQRLDKL